MIITIRLTYVGFALHDGKYGNKYFTFTIVLVAM